MIRRVNKSTGKVRGQSSLDELLQDVVVTVVKTPRWLLFSFNEKNKKDTYKYLYS